MVRDGSVVGKGTTQPPGQAHAEIVALREAREAARGAALYVTLEPCCHWGRTPPCTGEIIEAGVSEVVVAVADPNPVVAGKGMRELREAGVSVSLLHENMSGSHEIRELYEGFAKHIRTGMPFVLAKFAMSLDGKIATHTGDSKWVTGVLRPGRWSSRCDGRRTPSWSAPTPSRWTIHSSRHAARIANLCPGSLCG